MNNNNNTVQEYENFKQKKNLTLIFCFFTSAQIDCNCPFKDHLETFNLLDS
jgi:hypothetical protein